MKKLITLSIILSILLMAEHPIHDLMDFRIKGKSYTGLLDDNAAAEDGLGIIALSSYSISQSQANELLIQKVLSKIEKSETDRTKTMNIKEALTAGTVGTTVDLSLVQKYENILGPSLNPASLFSEVTPVVLATNANWGTNILPGSLYEYVKQYSGGYVTLDLGAQYYVGTIQFSDYEIENGMAFTNGTSSYNYRYSKDNITWKSGPTITYNWSPVDSTINDSFRYIEVSSATIFGTHTVGAFRLMNYYKVPETSFASCKALKTSNPSTVSGMYNITGIGQAYCDMDTVGGGWTLVVSHGDETGSSRTPVGDNLNITDTGKVLESAKWITLRNSSTETLYKLSDGTYGVSLISKLQQGNCSALGDEAPHPEG